MIGAGGAAASAIVACLRCGAGEVVIVKSHSRARGRAWRGGCGRGSRARWAARRFTVRGLDALADAALLERAAIVINATPMGLTRRGFARIEYARTSREMFLLRSHLRGPADGLFAPGDRAWTARGRRRRDAGQSGRTRVRAFQRRGAAAGRDAPRAIGAPGPRFPPTLTAPLHCRGFIHQHSQRRSAVAAESVEHLSFLSAIFFIPSPANDLGERSGSADSEAMSRPE